MAVSKSYKTTYVDSSEGYGIVVDKLHNGKLKIKGNPEHPTNKGIVLTKNGSSQYVKQDTSDRITAPEIRWSKDHPMEKVSWGTALERAANVFKSIVRKHGPNSVGFYISGNCLTEEAYLANKIVKGFIGTNNIASEASISMGGSIIANKKTFGDDTIPVSYDDIELADTFLIAATNTAKSHPLLFKRLKRHKENKAAIKIIVVSPRITETSSLADIHLQIIPGTELTLYNAIAKRLIDKNKIDTTFVREHTNNYEALKELLSQTSIAQAAKRCGITVAEIKLAAKYIGNAKGFLNIWNTSLNQITYSEEINTALLNLSLLTGHIGKPGSGPLALVKHANAMGIREVGATSNLLIAHKNLADPKQRKEVATFWGSENISGSPGLSALDMFDALERGTLKAIWILGSNPITSFPNSKKIESALAKANFVVVQELSHTAKTTKYADILLPAAGWLEKEGTLTNSERRINFLPKIIDAPGDILADTEVLWRFAQKMNFPGFNYQNVSEVFDEYCSLTKGTKIDISGLSHQRLKEIQSIQWPVPHKKHEGTVRRYTDRIFDTPNGKAAFNMTPDYESSKTTNTNFPLILTTEYIKEQRHKLTSTSQKQLESIRKEESYIQINGVDAHKRNLKDEDIAVIKTKFGSARVPVKVNYDIRRGVVFMPVHLGSILNNDTENSENANTTKQNIHKEPDFRHTPIEVTKYRKPQQKIILIGAGAAAYRFVKTYRQKNESDTIEIFSTEEHPFYNRILLPEYVSEELTWEQLQKVKEGELKKLNVLLHANNPIKEIDKKAKTITDSKDTKYNYDILLMATGSRAVLPQDTQIELPGRFTMRTKNDADGLKNYLEATKLPYEEQHVVIVGGGLLGLELAAALNKRKINITIIQRAGRLMERQLDRITSRLLAQDVQERGIQIYFDNEVSTVFENEEVNSLSVNLKTGKTLSANAIVYAIGTRPNIELAKSARLATQRGIVVNEYLQTSDPAIFAMGEIAEFNNQLFGITAAAEQQADVAAKYILGNRNNHYKGSVYINILKFEDLDLCSLGTIDFPENDPNYEEVILMDVSKRFYKRCIVKDDCLIGAILMGDKKEFERFKQLIEDKTELAEQRETLLRGTVANNIFVEGEKIKSNSI